MDRFLSWFEAPGKIDPLLIAGLAHVWFVTIHPPRAEQLLYDA
jgi:Fic family protein